MSPRRPGAWMRFSTLFVAYRPKWRQRHGVDAQKPGASRGRHGNGSLYRGRRIAGPREQALSQPGDQARSGLSRRRADRPDNAPARRERRQGAGPADCGGEPPRRGGLAACDPATEHGGRWLYHRPAADERDAPAFHHGPQMEPGGGSELHHQCHRLCVLHGGQHAVRAQELAGGRSLGQGPPWQADLGQYRYLYFAACHLGHHCAAARTGCRACALQRIGGADARDDGRRGDGRGRHQCRNPLCRPGPHGRVERLDRKAPAHLAQYPHLDRARPADHAILAVWPGGPQGHAGRCASHFAQSVQGSDGDGKLPGDAAAL